MFRLRPAALLALLGALASVASAQTSKITQAKERLVDTVVSSFAGWDTNHDGILDESELSRAVQDPNVVGDAAAAAAGLKSALRNKKAPKFPDWTVAYFKSDDVTLEFLAKEFRSAESRLQHTSNELISAEPLTLNQCKQGALGDCYLVAATGAAIARDPGIIRKMIQRDADGAHYTVKYPDGTEIRVPALTEGEKAMGGASTRDGFWMRILEKAWGMRRMSGSKRIDPGSEPIDAMGHGGSIRSTLEAMAGHTIRGHRLGGAKGGANVKPEDLRTELIEAIQAHRLIGAATPGTVSVPGISPNHAYAVLGFDEKTDSLSIWNPHVNRFTPKDVPGLTAGYPTVEGIFSMPLADFIATYSAISIETDKVKSTPPAPSAR